MTLNRCCPARQARNSSLKSTAVGGRFELLKNTRKCNQIVIKQGFISNPRQCGAFRNPNSGLPKLQKQKHEKLAGIVFRVGKNKNKNP